MSATLFERLFHKTILLRPTTEGVLEPMDITGHDRTFINEVDRAGNQRAIEIIPTRIYPVRGIKGIKKIAIHDFGTTQLLDLYSEENSHTMSEKTLADLLDISYHKGLKDAGTGGEMNKELARTLKIIMILSGAAAMISLLIYLNK